MKDAPSLVVKSDNLLRYTLAPHSLAIVEVPLAAPNAAVITAPVALMNELKTTPMVIKPRQSQCCTELCRETARTTARIASPSPQPKAREHRGRSISFDLSFRYERVSLSVRSMMAWLSYGNTRELCGRLNLVRS